MPLSPEKIQNVAHDVVDNQPIYAPLSDFQSDIAANDDNDDLTLEEGTALEVLTEMVAANGHFYVSYALEAKAQLPANERVERRITVELWKNATLVATMNRINLLFHNRSFSETTGVSVVGAKDDVFKIRLTTNYDLDLINVKQKLTIHKT